MGGFRQMCMATIAAIAGGTSVPANAWHQHRPGVGAAGLIGGKRTLSGVSKVVIGSPFMIHALDIVT